MQRTSSADRGNENEAVLPSGSGEETGRPKKRLRNRIRSPVKGAAVNRQTMNNAMKRKFFTVLLTLAGAWSFSGANAVEIWVSPEGSDTAPGTREAPKQTIHAALRQGRELRRLQDPSVADGVYIFVRGGEYRLWEPVFVRAEDSGTPESPTVIRNADGERPRLSGGVPVTGWRKAGGKIAGLPKAAQGKVWVAKAPLLSGRPFDFRQLWVNGKKAVRARDNAPDRMNRILSWDKQKREIWIPTPAAWPATGNPSPMEFTIHQMWAIAHLRIKNIEVRGDSARVTFHEPESRIQFEHPWPTPVIGTSTGNSPFYLSNALCLLDEPGEWFYDYRTQDVYYYPRPGEDMNRAEATVPALETLMNVEGTIDRPVKHVTVEGLSFEYTTWMRPSQQGHVPLQAGMYLIDAYKLKRPGTPEKRGLENQGWHGRPAAAVTVAWTQNVSFEKCRFEHLGGAGLDFLHGTENDIIRGCLFRDISGNAIQYGKVSDQAFESHLKYDPSDLREVSRNGLISNNLITECGNEDWGSVGILAGCVRELTIEHNELRELPYTGISLGWGWTKLVGAMRNNTVRANYIHHYAKHMYDVAAVYTLSAQPGTAIVENRADSIYSPPYVHDPKHWFYYYTDEGSSFMRIENNWCPAEKFLANANGPGNTWKNNGPTVSDEIRNAAGLEKEYRYLLTE